MADSEEVKAENDTSSRDTVEKIESEAEVINSSDNDKCTNDKKDVIVTESDAKSNEPSENHEKTNMINQDLKAESSGNSEPIKETAEVDSKEPTQEQEKTTENLEKSS